jgi:hypothetical protein
MWLATTISIPLCRQHIGLLPALYHRDAARVTAADVLALPIFGVA